MSGLTYSEMNDWRERVHNQLVGFFNVINPVDFYNFNLDPSTYTDREVKEYDLGAVRKSKIILVNLEYPDTIGTAIEVHMAHDEWSTPVIAYNGKDKDVHPWIKTSITKWCDTEEDAIDHILKFYVPLLCG
jgi:hypothetical protein